MKLPRSFTHFLLLTCIWTNVYGLHIGYAQESASVKDFTLNLQITPHHIVPYEPLQAGVTLNNISAAPVFVRGNFLWSVSFLITYENEPQPVIVYGKYAGKDTLVLPSKLLPKEQLRLSDQLFLYLTPGLREEVFVFDKVGTYRIKAQIFLSATQKLESEEVKIEVQRPSPDDVASAKIVTQRAAARMMSGVDLSEEGAVLLQSVVDKYPKSHFVDHAQFALGDYFGFLAGKRQYDEKKPVEAAEAVKQALEHYSRVSERIPSLKARAILAQAELIVRLPSTQRLADVPALLRELEARATEAEAMGLSQNWKQTGEKLRALMNRA